MLQRKVDTVSPIPILIPRRANGAYRLVATVQRMRNHRDHTSLHCDFVERLRPVSHVLLNVGLFSILQKARILSSARELDLTIILPFCNLWERSPSRPQVANIVQEYLAGNIRPGGSLQQSQ